MITTNDEDLAIGITTGVFDNEIVDEQQDEKAEKQAKESKKLLPNLQMVLDTLDEEIAVISDVRSYMSMNLEKVNGDDIKAEFRARELYVNLITSLKASLVSKALPAADEAEDFNV